MLDPVLKPILDANLKQIAAKLSGPDGEAGLTPGQMGGIGFVIGLIACFCVGVQSYILGLVVMLISRGVSALGRTMRDMQGQDQGRRSPYAGIVLDYILYGAFVLMFALGQPEQALAATFMAFTYSGLGLVSLALAASAVQGDTAEEGTVRTPSILSRLVERTENIVFMALCCMMPSAFAAFAVVFGALCWATTSAKVWEGR